jgi:hypothetical protein
MAGDMAVSHAGRNIRNLALGRCRTLSWGAIWANKRKPVSA